MKFLLISPPIEAPNIDNYMYQHVFNKKINKKYLYQIPPKDGFQDIGLLKIASFLKKQGNKVIFIDCKAEKMTGNNSIYKKTKIRTLKCGNYKQEKIDLDVYLYGLTYEEIKTKIISLNKPDKIFISSGMTYHCRPVHKIIQICNMIYPDVPITVGGVYATLCGKDINVDFVHRGFYHDAMDEYADFNFLDYNPKYASIKISYGCPNKCTYCAVDILEGNKTVFRNTDSIINEIKNKITNYGIKKFMLYGSNVLMQRREFEKLLNKLINLNIEIELPEGFQPNLLDLELLKKLKSAGLKDIALPLESTSPFFIKNKKRPTKNYNLKNTIKLCLLAGYKKENIYCFIMVGMPHQNFKEILNTIKYVWELGCIPDIFPYAIIPGSEDFKTYLKDKIKIRYEEYDPCLWPFAHENMKVHDLMCILGATEKTQLEYVQLMKNNVDFLKKIFNKNELKNIITKINYLKNVK